MYWALLAVPFDQFLAHVAVSRHWAHPEEVRLLHAFAYPLQVGAALVLMMFLWRYRSTPYFLIAAGLFSNALSYFEFGFVPDYIPFALFYNNSADLIISVSAIWLVIKLTLLRGRP